MTRTDCTDACYSIDQIAEKLAALGLPFADHFARALVGLISGRRISLQRVAEKMPGYHDAEANRQQLRRCLDHESLVPDSWALAIAPLLPQQELPQQELPQQEWVLALDRTEWRRGDTTINLLVLGVVVHGCAVPLLWTVMPSCGASDTEERIELLGRFDALFGRKRMRFLTADREFIGGDWIEWLLRRKLPLRIRIKANTLLMGADGTEKPAYTWFEKRANRCMAQPMEIWGMQLFVGGKRLSTVDDNGRAQYLIVISNERSDDLGQYYRLRWKSETMFQALKGRGFDPCHTLVASNPLGSPRKNASRTGLVSSRLASAGASVSARPWTKTSHCHSRITADAQSASFNAACVTYNRSSISSLADPISKSSHSVLNYWGR